MKNLVTDPELVRAWLLAQAGASLPPPAPPVAPLVPAVPVPPPQQRH